MGKSFVLLSLLYFFQGFSEIKADATTKKPTSANSIILPTPQNHPPLNKPSNLYAKPPTGTTNKINPTPHTPSPPTTKPPIPPNPSLIYSQPPKEDLINSNPQNYSTSPQKSVQDSSGSSKNVPPKQPQSNNFKSSSPQKAQTNAGSKIQAKPKNMPPKPAVVNAVPYNMNEAKSSPPKKLQASGSPQNQKMASVNSKKPSSNLKRSVNPKASPPKVFKTNNSAPQNLENLKISHPATISIPKNASQTTGQSSNVKPQNPIEHENSPSKTGHTSSNKSPSNPNISPQNLGHTSHIIPQNSSSLKNVTPNNGKLNYGSPQFNNNPNGQIQTNSNPPKIGPPNSASPQNKAMQINVGHPQNSVTPKNPAPKTKPAGRGNLQNPVGPKIGQTNTGNPHNSSLKNGQGHQHINLKNAAPKTNPANRVKKSNLSTPKQIQGCRHQKRGVCKMVQPQFRGPRGVTKPSIPAGGRIKKSVIMTYPEYRLYSMNHPYDDPSIWSVVANNRKRRSTGNGSEMGKDDLPKIRVKKDIMVAPGQIFYGLDSPIIEAHPFSGSSDWSSVTNYRKRRNIRHRPEMKVKSASRRSIGKNPIALQENLRHPEKNSPSLSTRKLLMTQSRPKVESNFLTNNRIRRSIPNRPEMKFSSASKNVGENFKETPKKLRHGRKISSEDFPSLSILHRNRKLLKTQEETPDMEINLMPKRMKKRFVVFSETLRKALNNSMKHAPTLLPLVQTLKPEVPEWEQEAVHDRKQRSTPDMETNFQPRRMNKRFVVFPEDLRKSLKNSMKHAPTLLPLVPEWEQAAVHDRKQRSIRADKPETKAKLQKVKSNAIPEDLFYSVKKPIVDAPYVKSKLTNKKPRGMSLNRPEVRLENPALAYFREMRRNSPLDNLNEKFWVKKV